MKKSEVILMGVLIALGVISLPEIAKLSMQSLISGICLGAACAQLAAGLQRQVSGAKPIKEQG